MQTRFFMTPADVMTFLRAVEDQTRLKYVLCGRFDSPAPSVFYEAHDLPNLGVCSADSSIATQSYLVSLVDYGISTRGIASAAKAPAYLFDQQANPATIIFTAGGWWKENILIGGQFGTAHGKNAESLALMKLFRSALRRHPLGFKAVGGVYVGREAHARWQEGARLTFAAQSPQAEDLGEPG